MELVLHEQAKTALARISARPAGSYLFYGPAGVGKAAAALELARSLNCRGDQPPAQCAACAQFVAGNYPDLITVRRQDKPSVTIEQIRRVTAALAMQPYYQAGTRFVIVDDAEFLTTDAANALLKLLEEPPPRTVFVLIAAAIETLLPTVRSRTAGVYFPLPPTAATAALVADRHRLKPSEAAALVADAGGAPGAALALAADPAAAAAQRELAALAASAPSQSLFQRLRLAARLSTDPAISNRFARLLQEHIVSATRSGASASDAARRLAALEQYRRHSAAKVAPRVALERLMVDLG